MTGKTDARSDTGRFAVLVALGILFSRIAGLIRDRVFAHYFGNSDAADAFKAALRIPNFLQNLFGEGVLSASFIPVYANLLARGDEREAGRVAGTILALVSLLVSLLVLAGIHFTPLMVDVIVPGFQGPKRELSIRLVQILFPGVGLFVMSAWCLGILNSHRRFFLAYAAPVIWNGAIIAALLLFGGRAGQFRLAELAAWGSVLGAALQFLVQLPRALTLAPRLRMAWKARVGNVRTVIRNFVPVFFSRGVVQISAYVDALLASLLPAGAVAALSYAQTLYLLPISLFGMSVSAAELPAMSSAYGRETEVADALRTRLDRGLRRIAFFVLPSAVGFFAFGDVIAAAIYQTGRFSRADAVYVWGVLAGYAIGLLAATLGRLYASAYYALRDTRTPLKYSLCRVVLAGALGFFCSLELPARIGIEARWGIVGLTAAAGFAAWCEYALLRLTLGRRIGRTGLPLHFRAALLGAALPSAAAGWAVKLALPAWHPIAIAASVLGTFGALYFALGALFRVPEARAVFERLARLAPLRRHGKRRR